MKKYKFFLLCVCALYLSSAVSQAKLPPLPGTTPSTDKPKATPAPNKKTSTSTNNEDETDPFQENREYYIRMEAAMRQLVVNSMKDALYIVKQDYILQSANGERKTQFGKPFFGRKYHIAVAANNRLWSTTSLLSPWVEDQAYTAFQKDWNPVRTTIGLRRLDIDRSMREVSMVSYVADNQYVGSYDYVQPIPYAQITAELTKTEGRLVMFYVDNGEDPETAEVKSLLFNIDPDWDTKGKIRNPIPTFSDKTFLGGIYLIEEKRSIVGDFSDNPGRSKKTQVETMPVGSIQFKIVGFYQKQGNDEYIAAIAQEGARDQKTKSSSRSGRASNRRR